MVPLIILENKEVFMPSIQKSLKFFAYLFFIILASSCNSSQVNKAVIDDTKSIKVEMGDEGEFFYLMVRSQGPINDALVGGLNSTLGPSKLVRQVADIMAKGENQSVRFAITGYSAAKNKDVILKAVEINKDKTLNKLKFMYIGYPEDREEIQNAVEKTGATFFFKSFVK